MPKLKSYFHFQTFSVASLLMVLLFFLCSYAVKSQVLGENEISVDGKLYHSINEAQKAIQNGSNVFLGPGTYTEGLEISKNRVLLSGIEGKTKFRKAVVQGKGTFVVSGNDIQIENIECSSVQVADNNGACVRQEGENLTLTNVYFHHSQQGVLSANNTGTLLIQFSRFEYLGKAGRAHGIYASNDTLIVRYSDVLNAVDQGHEIKSRAKHTVIEYSRVGSIESDDSRAIDISSGGTVEISNSIIFQGENTVNRQLIAYGLEPMARNRQHSIQLNRNLFILQRNGPNELLALPSDTDQPIKKQLINNIIVGHPIFDIEELTATNQYYKTRRDAGLRNDLPELNVLRALKLLSN